MPKSLAVLDHGRARVSISRPWMTLLSMGRNKKVLPPRRKQKSLWIRLTKSDVLTVVQSPQSKCIKPGPKSLLFKPKLSLHKRRHNRYQIKTNLEFRKMQMENWFLRLWGRSLWTRMRKSWFYKSQLNNLKMGRLMEWWDRFKIMIKLKKVWLMINLGNQYYLKG